MQGSLSKSNRILLILGAMMALQVYSLSAKADDFTFKIESGLNLRNQRLSSPQFIRAGAEISVSGDYIKKYLGTNPTQDQITKLLSDPRSAGVKASRFYDSYAKMNRYGYFVPVKVKRANGTEADGQMAVSTVFRRGAVTIGGEKVTKANVKPKVNIIVAAPETAKGEAKPEDSEAKAREKIRADRLAELAQTPLSQSHVTNVIVEDANTVASACIDCANGLGAQNGTMSAKNPAALDKIEVSQVVAIQAPQPALWSEYMDFARKFNREEMTNFPRGGVQSYKRKFISSLYRAFGPKKAGMITQAITSSWESPDRADETVQMAEIAAVQQVISNRSVSPPRAEATVLKDVGIAESDDRVLAASLADYQFSVWNNSDRSLRRLLSFNPDTSEAAYRRRMYLAFITQEKLAAGDITFAGALSNSSTQHYHANYVHPDWRSPKKQVAAIVEIKDGDAVKSVNLNRQSGATHLFYSGVQ